MPVPRLLLRTLQLILPTTPQLLLEYHLKELRLPTILREYDKVARQCAVEQLDYQRYLLRMTELKHWIANAVPNVVSGRRSLRSSRLRTASTSSLSRR